MKINRSHSDATRDRIETRPKMRSVAYWCVAYMRLKIISNRHSIESENFANSTASERASAYTAHRLIDTHTHTQVQMQCLC